jgi:hypothetical protein
LGWEIQTKYWGRKYRKEVGTEIQTGSQDKKSSSRGRGGHYPSGKKVSRTI